MPVDAASPAAAAPPVAPTAPAVATPAPTTLDAAAPAVVRDVSRASAIEAADSNRSIGLDASALRVIAARSGGSDGRTSTGSGTGPDSRASATLAALSPSHGRLPVSIS